MWIAHHVPETLKFNWECRLTLTKSPERDSWLSRGLSQRGPVRPLQLKPQRLLVTVSVFLGTPREGPVSLWGPQWFGICAFQTVTVTQRECWQNTHGIQTEFFWWLPEEVWQAFLPAQFAMQESCNKEAGHGTCKMAFLSAMCRLVFLQTEMNLGNNISRNATNKTLYNNE